MQSLLIFLEKVHYLNHPLLSSFTGLLFISIGLFVLSRDRKSKVFRLFFLIVFLPASWFICNAISMSYYNNVHVALLWYKIGYGLAAFMVAAYFHFYLVYSNKKNKFVYWLYLISILENIYLWFIVDLANGSKIWMNVGLFYDEMTAGAYFKIFGMVKYIIVMLMIALFFWNDSRKAVSYKKKKEIKSLSIIFFCLSLGAVEWIAAFGIPIHIGWLSMPPYVIAITYAILKNQLFEIKIVFKKALFYSIGIALASGFIIAISFLSNRLGNLPGFRLWTVPLAAGTAAFIVGRIFWNKSKEVDKLKYEFITVAAHKLRTPLTEIKWAADSLDDEIRSEKINKETGSKLVSGIKSANTRLIELTEELLSISKADTDLHKYNLEPINLERVARGVVNDFQHQMKEKKIKLIYNSEKNLPKVNLDKIRISSVIQMLLENAIMYTKDKITITINASKNNIVFHIEDNGIGINKEDQAYIFSKFYRSHEAYVTETEGTGISLFLAKSIIEKHDGKIGVRSGGRGKGSIFWFELPAIQAG